MKPKRIVTKLLEVDDDIDPAHYVKSQPIQIKAVCIEDLGDRVEAEFNAAAWFEQATLEQVVALANEEFSSSYEADDVAEHFSDTTLKDWWENYNGEGFEVYINEDDAKIWVQYNRPDWYATIWPNEIE